MDSSTKLAHYRQLLRQVIEMQAAMKPGDRQLESLAICDPANDNYLLMDVGYDHVGRADDVIIHLRLRGDGKVLIEYDGIEYGTAHDLIEANYPYLSTVSYRDKSTTIDRVHRFDSSEKVARFGKSRYAHFYCFKKRVNHCFTCANISSE
jgi:hypothetical protein